MAIRLCTYCPFLFSMVLICIEEPLCIYSYKTLYILAFFVFRGEIILNMLDGVVLNVCVTAKWIWQEGQFCDSQGILRCFG